MDKDGASGYAGAAEVAIDFFVSIRGMEQGSGAVEKSDKRKS
jgi:hypothetical protein